MRGTAVFLVLVMIAGSYTVTTAPHARAQLSAIRNQDTETSIFHGKPNGVASFKMLGEHVVVSVTVNGEVLNFLFDTGASATVIDQSVAKRIGLHPSGKISVIGTTGTEKLDVSTAKSLQCGGASLDNRVLFHADLKGLSESVGHPVHGIIGASLLQDYLVSVSHIENKIALFNPATTFNSSGFTCIHGTLVAPTIMAIPIEFTLLSGDTFRGIALLDSGFSGTLVVNQPFSQSHNLLAKIGRTVTEQANGLHGSTNLRVAKIQSISIGEHKFGEMEISISNSKSGALALNNQIGMLGNSIMKRFDMVIDLRTTRVYLKPNKLFRSEFQFQTFGVHLKLSNGKVIVRSVVSGSQAERFGLQAGDVIKSTNGNSTTDLVAIRSLLREVGKSITLVVEKQDGSNQTHEFVVEKLL